MVTGPQGAGSSIGGNGARDGKVALHSDEGREGLRVPAGYTCTGCLFVNSRSPRSERLRLGVSFSWCVFLVQAKKTGQVVELELLLIIESHVLSAVFTN